MSFVAKVFVVLNLIMSVFFLGIVMFEWSALTKWQKMYELEKGRSVELLLKQQKFEVGLAQTVVKAQEAATNARKDLIAEKLSHNEDKDKGLILQSQIAKTENEKQLLLAERDETGRQKDRALEGVMKANGVIMKQQQALMVERNNANQFKDEKQRLETDLNQTTGQLQVANRELHRAQQELAYANARLEKLVVSRPGILEGDGEDIGQPLIEGKVLAVRQDANLVMLSIGDQQKVKAGYRFSISKGSDYIGKVMVDKVYDTMCSARIIPALTNKAGLAFEPNQDARTR